MSFGKSLGQNKGYGRESISFFLYFIHVCIIWKELLDIDLFCAFLTFFLIFLYCNGFEAIARTVGHLSKSAEVMKLVNNLMKAPEMAATMQEFSKEMTKVILKFKVCIFVAFICQFLFHNFYHPC